MAELIYPQLSYKLLGICYSVHNQLGRKFQEKYHQRAIEVELKHGNIQYLREKRVNLQYKGESIGRYFVDFIIEEKIVLETKHIDFFKKKDYQQVMSYLNQLELKLAKISGLFHISI